MDIMGILNVGIGSFTLAKLLTTILLVVVGLVVVKALQRMAESLFKTMRVPATLLGILRAVVKVLLLFLMVIIIMGYLGIPVTSLVAAMSVIGVALSLGVQNFLTNVVGGLQMLVSQPFQVGDFVEAGGCSGTVREIGLFYTKIMTPDNKLIQLPNSSVVSANIVNYSAEETRRVDVVVTASYDAPVEKVETVLKQLVVSHGKVLTQPAPFARVSNYGASSIEYTIRAWCANADYWDVYFAATQNVKKIFDERGIVMTYPHLNVHLDK